MRRHIIAAVSAAALSLGTLSIPAPASANPAIIAAWIVTAGVGGLMTGAVVTHANQPTTVNYVVPEQQAEQPVVVQPQPQCHVAQERVNGVWRQVRICQ
ncbi:hypothetical protein [Methylovirgula sp. 4M-Z18]|uniref:hypothetical protein n=1 Tax=Methylovirgula sp. 4M-Z18 TaxID=2293567 RepID=UPI000E2F450B|nr:hypothetical protein [Methylovirgula sp. 4M-Z18]RFB80984.1 hypothetical protein DYH55_05820 [Methylovirgula sp. 4M-Z18]